MVTESTVVLHFPDGRHERRYPMRRRYSVGDDVECRGLYYVVEAVIEDESDLVVVTLATPDFERHGRPVSDRTAEDVARGAAAGS